jgi:hypothetical protein
MSVKYTHYINHDYVIDLLRISCNNHYCAYHNLLKDDFTRDLKDYI